VTMTEREQASMSDVRVEIAIANSTSAAVENAGVVNGRFELAISTHPVSLDRVPAEALAPILPGETRALVFEGRLVTLSLCTAAVRARPNPHRGLVTFGVTILTESSGLVLAGVAVDVTCPDAIPDAGVAIPCTGSAATACMSAGMPGQFSIHCSPTWNDAVADTFYCGTGVTDVIFGCDGYDRRSTSPGQGNNFFYDYYYERGSGALVAVISRQPSTREVCQGGPAGGFVLPGCIDPPQTKPGCPPGNTDGGRAEVRPPPGDGP
jgi:hypothetical protein